MKRRRVIRDEEERESDPLECLGMGRDRYYVEDDNEEVMERREREVVELLQWEL